MNRRFRVHISWEQFKTWRMLALGADFQILNFDLLKKSALVGLGVKIGSDFNELSETIYLQEEWRVVDKFAIMLYQRFALNSSINSPYYENRFGVKYYF